MTMVGSVNDINAKDGAGDWRLRKSDFPNLDVLVQPDQYLLARLPSDSPIPSLILELLSEPPSSVTKPLFCSVTRTNQELSILVSSWAEEGKFSSKSLETQLKVAGEDSDSNPQYGFDGSWRAFRIRGPMEFHLVGVMFEFSKCLAANGISIFAVSTWDTDYICVKSDKFEQAKQALASDRWKIVEDP